MVFSKILLKSCIFENLFFENTLWKTFENASYFCCRYFLLTCLSKKLSFRECMKWKFSKILLIYVLENFTISCIFERFCFSRIHLVNLLSRTSIMSILETSHLYNFSRILMCNSFRICCKCVMWDYVELVNVVIMLNKTLWSNCTYVYVLYYVCNYMLTHSSIYHLIWHVHTF